MSSKFLHKTMLLAFAAALMLSGTACLDDPVTEDYYNNIDLIKGKTRPQAPCLKIDNDGSDDIGEDLQYDPPYSCDMTVYFHVGCLKDLNSTPTPDDATDDTCVYKYTIDDVDCDFDSDGDPLLYYLYVSSSDPTGITNFDYYSAVYLYNEVYLGVPNPNNKATSMSDATFYFWAASWDGGRLSNHSAVVPVTFPFAAACP